MPKRLISTVLTEIYNSRRSEELTLFEGEIYSDTYTRFIVKEVIPYIEANYPVNKGAAHRHGY